MNRFLPVSICIFLFLLFGCSSKETSVSSDIYSSLLFKDVQLQAVFPDSKTFADCVPNTSWPEVIARYEKQRGELDFNISEFVNQHFKLPLRSAEEFDIDSLIPLENRLNSLWAILKREPDKHIYNSSLLPLPYPYIVPGGRFSEIYYWDSYFTMLGLEAQGHTGMVKDMVNNFAFLIDSVGFIPNGNRAYYLSRSQPPFFSLMIKLLERKDSLAALNYLPAMQKEYNFWMNDTVEIKLSEMPLNHVVKMPNGFLLNRYYDQKSVPRPEAYKEDFELAKDVEDKARLYRDLRSAAESGWDFSSRWFQDGMNLRTIQTTTYISVDLNCLLWHLETMLAKGYLLQGDNARHASYNAKADLRKEAILEYCYDSAFGYFFDFNFKSGELSPSLTLAGAYPLFFGLVDPTVAKNVATVIEKKFLHPGGLVTTLVNSGQQWDAPNGWAPLQWITYKGLKNYGHHRLANEIKTRWLHENEKVYKRTGKMVEKYNVMDTTLLAGGGEYPNQDGFGWTNGVYLAMLKDSLSVN